MKKILLFLLLTVLCFSTDGFKDLKWGANREEVIKIMGEPEYNKGQKIQYKQLIRFDNIYFRFVTLEFDSSKFVAWEGAGFVSEEELNVLIEHFQKKYKGFNVISSDNKTYVCNDTKGRIVLSYYKEYQEISIRYMSKEYLDKENKRLFRDENDL